MSERCASEAIVLAAASGRLAPRDLASLERHCATCAACAALQRDLTEMRDAVRAEPPPASPIEVARGRARLLREAAKAPGRSRRAAWLALPIAAAAAGAALLFGRHPDVIGEPARHLSAVHAPTLVLPAGETRFHRERQGDVEVVTLDAGVLDLRVQKLGPGQRFVVRAGADEVEVRGTHFRVEADAEGLRRAAVSEGRVEVRARGATTFVDAGATWEAPAPIDVDAPQTPRAVVRPTSDDAFARAVRHIERGEYDAAATALRSFEAGHVGDPRAEDAAFLAIVALERAGRPAAAEAAARRYQERYPRGARAREVQQRYATP